MARTKTCPAAPSAAHAAPDPAPAPDADAAPDSPAAAVCAALAANPAATVAAIAAAAATGKPAARDALLAMEKAGTASPGQGRQARNPGHLDPHRTRAGRRRPGSGPAQRAARPARRQPRRFRRERDSRRYRAGPPRRDR